MLDRLLVLQERGRPLINRGRAALAEFLADAQVRREVAALSTYYLGKMVSGCGNCIADTLIELCLIKKEKAMSKTKNFAVRRGKMLRDVVTHDVRKTLVCGNETDELALYHLHTNPACREFFERLPEDKVLEQMLADYAAHYEAKRAEANGGSVGNTEADKLINDATAKAAEIVKAAEEEAARINLAAAENAELTATEAAQAAAKVLSDAQAEAVAIIKAATPNDTEPVPAPDASTTVAPVSETAARAVSKARTAAKVDPILE